LEFPRQSLGASISRRCNQSNCGLEVHTFSSDQMSKVMHEKQLLDAMNRLTEELYQFRVLLTPELRKQEVVEKIEKTDKELMASIRRKSRA
jgi:hypothetical protein